MDMRTHNDLPSFNLYAKAYAKPKTRIRDVVAVVAAMGILYAAADFAWREVVVCDPCEWLTINETYLEIVR